MSLSIDLSPELESRIREQAAARGMAAPEYVVRRLEEHLGQFGGGEVAALPEAEARLLQEINAGLPEETWRRYRELVAQRQAESLEDAERAELIGISDRIEALNARRIERLAELARLRKVSLPALMHQLGIGPVPYV